MTAKEYLSELDTMRQIIESQELELERLYTEASGLRAITYDKDAVQVSPENRFEEMMLRIYELGDEIVEQNTRFRKEYNKRLQMICQMKKSQYVMVLRKRYIDGKTLKQITKEVNYSYESVKKIHGRALQAFGDKYRKVLNR